MNMDAQFRNPIVVINLLTGAGYVRIEEIWAQEARTGGGIHRVEPLQEAQGQVYPQYVQALVRFKELLDDGQSVDEAAAVLGWTTKRATSLRQWLGRLPLYIRICDLAREGYALTQIAQNTEQEIQTVSNICKRMGLQLSRLPRGRRAAS
ncbi:MAG: hypothetical protein U1D96_05270 [Eubacteriales bacterium]|nr:hypothetical protein [Clostridia bacterium]MDZ4042890.1 hypothetical protein [Eubacteriales bacterium]